jgi:hypothetical protein
LVLIQPSKLKVAGSNPAGVANSSYRKARIFGAFLPSVDRGNERTEEDRKGISGIFRDRESRTESRKTSRSAERPRSGRSGKATGDPPKKRRKKRAKVAQKSQATEEHFFYVTHGQTNAGLVRQVDETYKAIGADEQELGTFGNLKAAADAVSAHYDQNSRAELLHEGVS